MPKRREGPRRTGGRRPRKGDQRRRRGDRGRRPGPHREIVATGHARDVGLDGGLRVELAPIRLATAQALTGRGGAQVMTSRGESIGRVTSVVGTLERPIAVVKVHPHMRKVASDVMGREVFLG